jgi:CRISPR-associated protein Cmr3
MEWIKFEATDAWFFRDGRPFNAGEESWANSIFPPYPSVLYGVMRTVFFAANMAEFPKANTGADPSADLRIRQYGLHLSDMGLAFPVPADLLREKETKKLHLLKLTDRPPSLVSSYKSAYSHLLQSPFPEKSDDIFGKSALPLADFTQYLLGNVPTNLAEFKHYVSPEYKVGLGREQDTRQADEGMLYKVTYRRPTGYMEDMKKPEKTVSLAVAIEDLALPTAGLTKFGADGKLAIFASMDAPTLPTPPTVVADEIFKLYFATPAFFEEGWAPLSLFEKYGLKICTAAVGKPIPIGGWDMEKKQPKPMRKAVPAGSVYYRQQQEGGNAQGFINDFHGKALPNPHDLDHQGFGIAYFGKSFSAK